MAPKYTLTYFNVKGYGEPIRWLFSYADIEFENVTIDFEEWKQSIKASEYKILLDYRYNF